MTEKTPMRFFVNLFTDYEGWPWKAALARRVIHYLPESTRRTWPDFLDGSIVYSWNTSPIGHMAIRVVGGDKYAHVGIIFDNHVYEAAVPQVQKLKIGQHERENDVYEYFSPVTPFTSDEVAAMKAQAESMLGLPYTLRNYFKPWTKPTKGTWCSPYVARVLNASGRYTLTKTDWREPQDLFQRLEQDYRQAKLTTDDAP